MAILRRARDLELLDALDALDRVSVDDVVWRVVRSGRDPLQGYPSAGRWDSGQFDVLYTAFDPDGAVSEMHFQLSRQPVFPFKIQFSLNEIAVKTKNTLKFADLRELQPFGVEEDRYPGVLYERTQMIGDAAAFLGFDGLIAPNARWQCLNLVVFSDCLSPADLKLRNSSAIDWVSWRRKHTNND